MKMAMSRLTLTCLPTSSIVIAVAEKYKQTWNVILPQQDKFKQSQFLNLG